MQKTSSRIKRKTQKEIETLLLQKLKERKKNIRSTEKMKVAKTGKNIRMNMENQEMN